MTGKYVCGYATLKKQNACFWRLFGNTTESHLKRNEKLSKQASCPSLSCAWLATGWIKSLMILGYLKQRNSIFNSIWGRSRNVKCWTNFLSLCSFSVRGFRRNHIIIKESWIKLWRGKFDLRILIFSPLTMIYCPTFSHSISQDTTVSKDNSFHSYMGWSHNLKFSLYSSLSPTSIFFRVQWVWYKPKRGIVT